jgi:hypothetical protein
MWIYFWNVCESNFRGFDNDILQNPTADISIIRKKNEGYEKLMKVAEFECKKGNFMLINYSNSSILINPSSNDNWIKKGQ